MRIHQKMAALLAVCLLLCMVPYGASADTLRVEKVVMSPDVVHVGDVARWTVTAAGGAAPYTYEYSLNKKPVFRDIVFAMPESLQSTDSNIYEFPLSHEDVVYRFNVTVTDSRGRETSYQSEWIEPASGLTEKIREVVAECAYDGLSDYEKAYNLYDWLCVNAEYDYTYTWYSAAGVLLHGTGVCDSFSRAYSLLLDEVGIENSIVHGTADYSGESHAWVMVKLDGEWYHMDPTWDEANDFKFYFGLNTELIERDHTSLYLFDANTLEENKDIPVTTATRYNYALNHADGVFETVDELTALFDALEPDRSTFNMYCVGTVTEDELFAWCDEHYARYGFTSWGYNGSPQLIVNLSGERNVPVILPAGLKEIQAEAFLCDYYIRNVVVKGEKLRSVGSKAFWGCVNMSSINLPASVEYIADDAFEYCDGLTIICTEGSYAHTWCINHQMPFELK